MIADLMMSSTRCYKKSFNLSFDPGGSEVRQDLFVPKIKKMIQEILNERFDRWEKREVRDKVNRLNFSCPYCGDSHIDLHKKRGNIYTNSFYFKCYNCGKYRGLDRFFADFKKALSADEIVFVRDREEKSRTEVNHIDPMMLLDSGSMTKWGIDRAVIEKKYNLEKAESTKIATYLKKRLQPDLSRFSWSDEKQQLYIFHTVPGTEKVLGYQIRNFKSTPKYLTFKLSRIYEDLGLQVPDEVLDIDPISTIFGILSVDYSQPITVFEGPLDSFLYRNSVATCSSGHDVPVDLGTLRFMYDYDKAGREAALEKANQGRPVFLWKKLLDDLGIELYGKKTDLTDFLTLCSRKGIKVPRLSNYFSTDRYDTYWL